MVFPRYKEWMGESFKLGSVYVNGVKEFVAFAQKCMGTDLIPCPCVRCRNGKLFKVEVVKLHLIQHGMLSDYTFWVYHGERDNAYIPEESISMETVHIGDDSGGHPSLNDLINDAQETHISNENLDNIENDFGCEEQVFDDTHLNKEYLRLKTLASTPLYDNCNLDHTMLYAMVGLHNIKSKFGLSGNSVTSILLWVKDMLPKENTLPISYSIMKRNLKGLGMKYKSIHCCIYDCALYYKEHKDKLACPICKEPRFEHKIKLHNKRLLRIDTKIPRKVLKYFPLGPRLKRLYTIPWIAEAMTWHGRAKVGENLMRHPIDSPMWKSANQRYPDFSKEIRNVRLAISTDGFNPFGKLSTDKSIWPVFTAPLNFCPSLSMRKEFSILSLLIPGPKAPGSDIDIFLRPLIDELDELWVKGVKAYDSYKKENFTLRAMLLWAIHDFPAYGTLSGCNVHGYLGCPICGEDTKADWLTNSNKLFYHSHRRFLPQNHKFRSRKNFLNKGIEIRPPPQRLSGSEIEEMSTKADKQLTGKHPTFLAKKRKRKSVDAKTAWSRRSILFNFPYWKEHPLRHVIDIMHAEKNVIEHIVGTCLGGAHTKDGEKAREDLRKMEIREPLWMQINPDTGKKHMPDASFTLSVHEKNTFLKTLKELKVPSNFSSNLRRIVCDETKDLRKCKSHDWHVIMQLVPLLFGHCFSEHKDLRRAILQISLCFSLICEKVVNKKHLMAAKETLAEATCVLEKYFTPSFFDISIHLLVHLCDEALLCGPVRYRWMYPFERLMKTFKEYVKNTRYVEGSIAEEYIMEEASMYAKEYMPDPNITCRERFVDELEEFADEEALGTCKVVTLTHTQYNQVARYVLETHDDIDEWKGKFNECGRAKKKKGGAGVSNDFRHWLASELLKDQIVKTRLARLANGPSFVAKEFKQYRVNGFVFSSSSHDLKLIGKQNSGISYKALTLFRASAKDKNLIEAPKTYYGIIRQILILDYTSFSVPVFYCDWVKVEACTVDPETHLVNVDLTKLKSRDNMNDEPFVCAFQNLKQVFYANSPNKDSWSIVLHSPKRLTTLVDDIEAPVDIQSVLDDYPEFKNLLVTLED